MLKATLISSLNSIHSEGKLNWLWLAESLATHRREYRDNPKAAKAMLAVGEAPRPQSIDPAEFAAWTVLSNLLLNLDEAITKN